MIANINIFRDVNKLFIFFCLFVDDASSSYKKKMNIAPLISSSRREGQRNMIGN